MINIGNIKSQYPILIIKLLIIALFVVTVIYTFLNILKYYNVNNGGFFEYLTIAFSQFYLKLAAIRLVPFIGVFINRKMGWILIMSYFYYLISNAVFSFAHYSLADNVLVSIKIIAILLLFLIVFVMNKKRVSSFVYGINKDKLMNVNMIASIIGMLTTIGLALLE